MNTNINLHEILLKDTFRLHCRRFNIRNMLYTPYELCEALEKGRETSSTNERTWQDLDVFQKSLRPRALGESSLSTKRVKTPFLTSLSNR